MQSSMRLRDLKDKSECDTSLTQGGTICVVSSQRKVENGVPCAVP